MKHIFPLSIEDWIRTSNKLHSNVSIIWKAMLTSFQLIEDGLAWRSGNGGQVRIGMNP